MSKSKPRRIVISWLLLLIILLTAAGCSCSSVDPDTISALENVADWQIMGMGTTFPPGGAFRRIKILEEDDYGRIFFIKSNKLTRDSESEVTAYVICQKTDGGTGYCLPDICYELVQYGAELSEDRVLELKERNGWGTEPDDTGWASYNVFGIINFNEKSVLRAVDSMCGSGADIERSYTRYMESDQNGLNMFGCVLISKADSSSQLYLAVLDTNNVCISCREVENIEDLTEIKIELKSEVGWEQRY